MQGQKPLAPEVIDSTVSFLESWLSFRYDRLEIPGFVALVKINSKVVFKRAYGYANLEKKEPMTTDHIFRIASHSKTFAATALMKLQEQGKLNIDEPVAKYVPWLHEHKDKRMAEVTIRQLMAHSSGIIRDGLDCDFWELTHVFPDLAKLKEEILRADLVFDTNTIMKYSNYGYSLIGLVVESAAKQSFHDYVNEQIIKPLGLKNVDTEIKPEVADRLVTGYSRRDLNKTRQPINGMIDTKSMEAAAGFYASAEDLATYFDAHLVGSGKMLTNDSKKEMQRTQWQIPNASDNSEYGLGMGILRVDGRRLFGHGGGFPGQITKTLCDPKQKIVVVVLTNCIDGEAETIAKGIYTVLDHFERSHKACRERKFGEFARFEGRYMCLWSIEQVLQNGDQLLAFNPDTWQPFSKNNEPQELEYDQGDTFKIEKCSGVLSLGENVTFEFESTGAVKSVRFGGLTIWPEDTYLSNLKSAKTEKLTAVR